MAVVRTFMGLFFVEEFQKVLSVLVLEHRLGKCAQLVRRDPPVAVGDAFQTGDLKTLTLLDDLHEDRGFGQRVVRARIQPREAPLKRLHLQLAALQERLVDARDLKLPTCGGLDTLRDIHDLVRVEVQAHHCVVRLRVCGFLLDRKAVTHRIELRHAIALGLLDTVAEDRSLAILLRRADGLAKKTREARAVEDIVPQNQTHGVVADEVRADKECLCKTVRGRLLGIRDTNTVVGAVAQKTSETRKVIRCRDNHDIADTRKKQSRERVVDHRLIINRKQLLADTFRDRIQAAAAPAR